MTLYLDSIITFGKYSGKRVSDLPKDYTDWLTENTKHKIRLCNTPPPEVVEPNLNVVSTAKAEDNFRRMCTEIGRKLIYDNVQIPF